MITTDSGTFTAFTKVENTETTVVIKTYRATDVDADTTLTWSLEGNDAGDFSITKNTQGHGELKFANVPNYELPDDANTMNDYDIRVKVKDDGIPGNRSASNQLDDIVSVTVTVEDVNETPVVSGDATPSFAEIEFDATSADLTIGTYTAIDDDGDSVTWDVIGRDSAHFTIHETSGVLSFSIRPDFENPVDKRGSNNIYDIKVTASDGLDAIVGVGKYTVTVTVTNVDETPEITTTGPTHATPSFAEIEYDATTADLAVADYAARDEEDNQNITWSKAGTDAGDFTIDTNTGVLSFAQRPNFEMPVDGTTPPDNVYNVIVKATDTTSPLKTRELVVTVTVTDVNERPDISEDTVPSYAEVEYDFIGTLPNVHTFSATDYDAGDTFEWTLLGTDAGVLEIDRSTGVLTFTQDANSGPLPNFEAPQDDDTAGSNTYHITLVATDNRGYVAEYAVIVTVTDVNEVPELTGTPETAITLDEHDANETYTTPTVADYDASDEEGGVTWSLTGTDSGDFAIDGNGVVTFKAAPNREDPDDSNGDNVYTFTVVATDVESGTNRLTDSVAVTVTVDDVEEAGTITFTVNDDAANNSPAVGDTIKFTLTDPDGGIVTGLYPDGFEWQIESRVSEYAAWQELLTIPINNSSVQYRYEVEEEDTGNQLRAVVASYQDRRGSGKLAESEPTTAVTMDPIANAPPRFLGPGPQFVPEGPAGQNVGDPPEVSDRENDTLTFGLTGSDSRYFEIDSSTGQIRTTQELDYETTTTSLYITVTLHDGKGVIGGTNQVTIDESVDDRKIFDITVTDVEEDGIVTLSSTEPVVGVQLEATLADGDGDVSGESWQWARSENEQIGWINISGATSSSYTPVDTDRGFYLRASVTYTDRRGAGKSAEAFTTEQVFGANRSPTFPSAENGQRSVAENTEAPVAIGAPVAAEDPDDDRLTYSLSGTDAAAFSIVTTTGQLRTLEPLDFEDKSSYRVNVEVHDGLDGSGNTSTTIDATQAVTITIENVEEPGTVTLTTDTATIQARVEVTAELEDDDKPTVVRWQWSRSPNGRTDWVNISGANSATYTPTLEDDAGNYIRATASYTDGHGPNKSANAVSSRVGDPRPVNSAPAFPSMEDGQREVAENTRARESIGDPVAAEDPENDRLTYSLSGTDAAAFSIVTTTGQLRTLEPLDFEDKSSYRVNVEVHDGLDGSGNTSTTIDATQAVTITIENVEEPGTVTLTTDTATIQARVEVTAELEDDDKPTVVRWQWSRSPNGRTDWVNISGATSATYTPTLEEDQGNYIRALANYTDGHGPNKSANAVSSRVGGPPPANSAPAFSATEDGQREVAENTRARESIGDPVAAEDPENDRLTYSLSGTDAAAFSIVTTTGQLRTLEPLDFEDKSSYRVNVEVHDGLDGSGNTSTTIDATQAVTITIENVEEPGTVTLTTDTATIQARVEVTAELEDDDKPTVVRWQWSRSPNGRTDWVNISGATSATYTPTLEEDQGNYIRALANYTDGYGPNKSANAVSSRVGGPPPANSAPAFPATEDGQRETPENTIGGTIIGDPVAANDLDGDTLTYSLTGTDAASFTIDENSGQLRLAQNVMLDYEGKRTHRFTVQVTDGVDQNGDDDIAIDDTLNVTVTVTNVNEAPVVTGDNAPSFQENDSSAVASYTAADPEGDKFTWSVDDPTNFWISERGQLYFRTPASFEDQETYTVDVIATDDDETTPCQAHCP